MMWKAMKKLFVMAAALVLLASGLFSARTEGGNHTLLFDSEIGAVLDLCSAEDAFYLLSQKGVYKWQGDEKAPEKIQSLSVFQRQGIGRKAPEDSAERALWEQAIGRIFMLEGKLLGLHPYTGRLRTIGAERIEDFGMLPQEQYFYMDNEERQPKDILCCKAEGGSLYLALESFTAAKGKFVELYVWKPGESEMKLLDGQKWDAVWDGSGESLIVRSAEGKVSLYDIKTLSEARLLWEEKADAKGSGYVWSAEKEALTFLGESGKVMGASAKGKPIVKAYLPIGFSDKSDRGWLSADGRYIYLHQGNLYVRLLDESGKLQQKTLHIVGRLGPNVVGAFAAERPDIAISMKEDAPTDFLSVQQAMISQDDSNDIYVLNAKLSYMHVVKKGYAAPMNGSAALLADVESFYPAIQQTLLRGGTLYGYPSQVSTKNWSINETQWKNIGLGEYPATMQEVIDYIKLWNEKYAEDHPEYSMFETAGGFRSVVSFVIRQYILENEKEGETLNFDSQELRSVLSLLWENRALFEEDTEGRMPLIMRYAQGYGSAYNDEDRAISFTPPAISDACKRPVDVDMEIFVLNPKSKHMDEAIAFVEFFAKNRELTQKYMMSPAGNVPIRPRGFAQMQEEILEKIDYLKQQLTTAEAKEKQDIEALIQAQEQFYAYRENAVWEVRQDDIDRHQKIAALIVPPMDTVFADDGLRSKDKTIEEVNHMFADGAVPVDLFIEMLNEKAKLISLESAD